MSMLEEICPMTETLKRLGDFIFVKFLMEYQHRKNFMG